jgi:squalene-associated FAD-dependent desaturase
MGCCTNLADFFIRTGVEGKMGLFQEMTFTAGDGGRWKIGRSWLPAPFHLAPSFARFGALSWKEKRAIAGLLMLLVRTQGKPGDTENVSMLDWLRRHGQAERAIALFWRTVLVSTLNEEPERTGSQYGVDVFWRVFLANKAGFTLGVPAAPLGDLYEGCRSAIEKAGGEVRFRESVREILTAEGRFAGVETERGETLRADAGIAAVPPDALAGILPKAAVESSPELRNLNRLHGSPITGVHLWFDRKVMEEPFLVVLDKTIQWIFNKSALYSEKSGVPEKNSAQYVQIVISASYDLVRKSRQEIIDLCMEEAASVLPAVRGARLVKGTVIKEVAATFSPEPGVDQWRAGAESPIKGLWMAGDWTRTGWPATMEGAVRSGYRAAELLLEAGGRPRKFLQPDLPVERLTRWLAG